MKGVRNKQKGRESTVRTDTTEENVENDGEGQENITHEAPQEEGALLAGLANIRSDIQSLKQDLQDSFKTFKQELKQDMVTYRQEIDKKLDESKAEIQHQKTTMSEAQTRIAELEECSTEAGEALTELRKLTRRLEEKVTDLEARSRRNNIRIFGLPEDEEGSDMIKYIDLFLTSQLQLPEGTNLQIQRAHRAIGRKPIPGTAPRSIVINFLQHETKEMIIKKAWQKKLFVNEKRIWFDHDYPTEVVLKRKSFNEIKKKLKENGIRFQTPFTKMRIHWSNGVRTYETAREAALDMRERGYEIGVQNEVNDAAGRENTGWIRVKDRRPNQNTARRAREKLQDYQLVK